MTLNKQQVKELVLLRLAVGFLGEQASPKWWNSSFCGDNGKAFLSPVFPRTYVNAQYQGVVASASLVHDVGMSRGNVFHLFRLPEDMEQALQTVITDATNDTFSDVMKDAGAAMEFLRGYAGGGRISSQGPVRVGQLAALREMAIWKDVASCYLYGFEQQREIFPFFSDKE